MPLPVVAVAANKYYNGISDLTERAPALQPLPIDQALSMAWPTDAHFVTYFPVNSGSAEYPRMNKPVLPKLRHHGADLLTQVLAFDYDNPDHAKWSQDLYAFFWRTLQTAAEIWPLAGEWSALYTTRGGARIVFLLDQPIPVDVAEGKHRWMVQQLGKVGLRVDPLSDWTRLFRLPFVKRDGKDSWIEQQMYFYHHWEKCISAEKIPTLTVGTNHEYADIRQFTDPKPTQEQIDDLLETVSRESGRKVQTAWYKSAKARLKGRECYPCLFEHAPLATKGARDETLHKFVGEAVAMLYYLKGTTPQHIYALFLDPVLQLQPDEQTRDWTTCLWSHIGRIWVREEAKKLQIEIEQQKDAEDALTIFENVIQGMRGWCDAPQLKTNDPASRKWVDEHLIASADGRYYVMTPNGTYDEASVSRNELIARIRALKMDGVIKCRFPLDTGEWKYYDAQEVIDAHATIVSNVRGIPQVSGGYIEAIDSGSATLVVPSYCRNPHLTPEYNYDVDTWLMQFFGNRYYEGCEWIANALAFEEGPICAISIKGDPGAGKKIIPVGLSECLTRPKLATADDLIGQNQYNLLNTPFLHIDEGWPTAASRTRHPADQFRALVSGQAFDCNRKYRAPVEVSNPLRIVFTANNMTVVQMLTAGRELSPEDREALTVRLKHFDIGDKASVFLRTMGGLKHTGRAGQRWIKGDGGQPTDYVVARHFLFLYSLRPPFAQDPSKFGARFLVEGDAQSDVIMEMRTTAGAAPLVIETVIKLLNLQTERQGICIENNRLYVLSHEVLEYYRENLSHATRDKLTAGTIGTVFQSLTVKGSATDAFELASRHQIGRRRWHELDPEILLAVARRDGWSCKKLELLVEARRKAGLGVKR